MSIFSSELNIIKKGIIKVEDKVIRDYNELENIQSSHKNNDNFVNMTIEYIKMTLFNYFKERKPDYDIIFLNDNSIDEKSLKSKYRYLVSPLCGKINLLHSIPYFSISVALQIKQPDETFKTVCGAIENPITKETFYTEEGQGAYIESINNRRIRVSSRVDINSSICAIKNVDNKDFILNCVKKYNNIMITNCEILNICYVASGKYDFTILEKKLPYQDLSLLLIKESGGLTKKLDNGNFIVSNNSLISKI